VLRVRERGNVKRKRAPKPKAAAVLATQKKEALTLVDGNVPKEKTENRADPFVIAKKAAEALMDCPNARAVLLTGSLIEDVESAADDIDLLVVTDDPRPEWKDVLRGLEQKFGGVHPEDAPGTQGHSQE
jgi:hypothetical protein